MRFTANTRLYITAEATMKSLSFKIVDATFDELSFDVVDKYAVNNFDLAKWKAESVLKKVVNTMTFGTGYPTLIR